MKLTNGKAEIDDIDHLSNRRVRTVGEQLICPVRCWFGPYGQNDPWKDERKDNEVYSVDLINARTLSSVINSFFGTSQLSSSLTRQTRWEITHKRRISALGPGGLSRESRFRGAWRTLLSLRPPLYPLKRRKVRTSVLSPRFACMPRSMTWALSKPLP